MTRFRFIGELVEAVGNAFRGPLPLPTPVPPVRPRPLPPTRLPEDAPRPQPQPQPPRLPRLPQGLDDGPGVDGPELADEPQQAGPEHDQQTETGEATEVEEDQECETCPDCDPRNDGVLRDYNYGTISGKPLEGYYYQNWVCPWHAHWPSETRIWEWLWLNIRFDGLDPGACVLYEAKSGYDEFLEQDEWLSGGRPELADWIRRTGNDPFAASRAQALEQSYAVRPFSPKVELKWVFSAQATLIYMQEYFLDRGLIEIDPEHRPWSGRGD